MQKHTIVSLETLVENLRSQVKTLRTERNNFRAMYENAKDRKHIARLEQKITKQAEVIELQSETIRLLREQNETLRLRVDELERMVFGKHKRKDKDPPSGGSGYDASVHADVPPPPKRPPFSYRRSIPEESKITETKNIPLDACPDCGHVLGNTKTVIRFIEDIPSIDSIQQLLHSVTKLSVATGYCPCCRTRKAATPIPNQTVSIGDNVRALVSYLSVIQNQGYSQISRFFSDFSGISLSDGGIADILETEKMRLVPECEAIKDRIRNGSIVHYDETGWPVSKEEQGNYAWAMTNPGLKSEIAFLAGRSRGRGNAEELRGKDPSLHIGITDDYGAYRNTFEKHGLCWAHPLRKFRDLSESSSLEGEKHELCKQTYESFKLLYGSLREILEKENGYYQNTKEWRRSKIRKSERILRKQFRALARSNKNDPKKLKTLKESLLKNEDKYFVCLELPGVPADNNKAERSLRHIVLKRKTSQGSKTQKGADVFSVLATVLLSLKAKYPNDFFAKYHELRTSLA